MRCCVIILIFYITHIDETKATTNTSLLVICVDACETTVEIERDVVDDDNGAFVIDTSFGVVAAVATVTVVRRIVLGQTLQFAKDNTESKSMFFEDALRTQEIHNFFLKKTIEQTKQMYFAT
jgi:hypothetical protein